MGLAPPGRLEPFRVVSSTCPSLLALPLGLVGRMLVSHSRFRSRGSIFRVCEIFRVCVPLCCVCQILRVCPIFRVCVCVKSSVCVCARALARLFATGLSPPASLLAEMLLVRRAGCVCTSVPVWEDEEFSWGFYALHLELCFSAQRITFWVVTGQIFAWILTASPTLAYRLR